jgi:hypothetical protein
LNQNERSGAPDGTDKMKRPLITLSILLLLLPMLIRGSAGPLAEKISVGQIRALLQHLGGGDLPAEKVQIRKISSGLAGDVVVEAQIETAWRLVREKEKWRVAEVRLGDRHWESLELVEEAVRREKIRRTLALLQQLDGAIDAYYREERKYLDSERIADLLDALSPRYISTPHRFDLWGNQFDYEGRANRYRLRSAGPDGRLGTADDLIVTGGTPDAHR